MEQKKTSREITVLLIASALSFVWLLLILLTPTGAKETADFTARDWLVWGVFLVLEAAAVGTMLFLSLRLCLRLLRQKRAAQPKKPKDAPRPNCMWIAGAAVVYLALIVGALLSRTQVLSTAGWGLGLVCMFLPTAMIGVNLLLDRRMIRRFDGMSAKEKQRLLLSQREDPEATAQEQVCKLRVIRRAAVAYAMALFAVSLAGAFLLGLKGSAPHCSALWWFPALGGAAAAMRVRLPRKKETFTAESGFISEAEYPVLYAVARRAEAAFGLTAPVHICLDASVNAGIARVDGAYAVSLGAVYLGLQTEAELYETMLHEFAHMAGERSPRETDYWNTRVGQSNGDRGVGDLLQALLFQWPDRLYALHYALYEYAGSLGEEGRADEAMVQYGDAATAASSLLHLKYQELYAWEAEGWDRPWLDTLEKKVQSLLGDRIAAVRAAEQTRGRFYRELTRKEILSRSASHPTIQMRLEAMGCPDGELLPRVENPAYDAEVEKAVAQAARWLMEQNSPEDYAAQVETSRKTVADWEAAGRPVEMETYVDIQGELRNMGRLTEAMALCDRAIAELPPAGAVVARYIRGCCRLHQWDDGGLEDIYAALENNSNFIREGLDQIGSYCCLTGNQPELDRYREKALEYAQKEQDMYDEIEKLDKRDDLSRETLPAALEGKLKAFFASLPADQLEAVYLLHKQITPDFFCSPVILRFRSEATPEQRDELMHRTFRFLDGVDSWQFSLFPYEDAAKVRPERIEGSLFFTPRP